MLVLGGCRGPGAVPETRARLSELQATGAGPMYPAFDPGVLHYAVRCADGTTVQLAARAADADATLRLLHDGSTGTGSLAASITLNRDLDIDIAIQVGDSPSAATYVVHCIPPDFPDIVIETSTAGVSDGLLLMTPGVRRSDKSFLAIVDNNGVPRWVMRPNQRARNFRRHPDGRYSFSEQRQADGEASVDRQVILDARSGDRRGPPAGGPACRNTPAGMTSSSWTTELPGDVLLPGAARFQRVRCDGEPCSVPPGTATDSVIQEVTPDGNLVLEWNSWEHVKIEDCTIHRFPEDYAHLNSLHELEGDIVAGLRGCAQVLLLERATGAVVWQMGGDPAIRTDRPAPSTGAARYLR